MAEVKYTNIKIDKVLNGKTYYSLEIPKDNFDDFKITIDPSVDILRVTKNINDIDFIEVTKMDFFKFDSNIEIEQTETGTYFYGPTEILTDLFGLIFAKMRRINNLIEKHDFLNYNILLNAMNEACDRE